MREEAHKIWFRTAQARDQQQRKPFSGVNFETLIECEHDIDPPKSHLQEVQFRTRGSVKLVNLVAIYLHEILIRCAAECGFVCVYGKGTNLEWEGE